MMKTTLEIVVALARGLLFSGAVIGASFIGACAVAGGGCWLLWRWWKGGR